MDTLSLCHRVKLLNALAFLLVLTMPFKAWSTPIELIFENDSAVLNNNVFTVTYDSLTDFNNANAASSQLTANNFQTGGDIAGFTYDGSLYHLIFENNPATLNNEVFLLSFATLADFNNANFALIELTSNNFQTGGDIAGFTYDGSQYHILFENDPAVLNNELFLVSYDSINDFINANEADLVLTQQNFQTGGDVAGFAYDGTQYHIVFENNPDTLNNSVFTLSYDSLADVINANAANIVLTNNNFQTGGDIVGVEAINTFGSPISLNESPLFWLYLAGCSLAVFMTRANRDGVHCIANSC